VAVFLLSFCATAAGGTFSRATIARLAALPPAHALIVTGFPAGPSHSATVRFERAEIYAPGAHLYVIGANGKQEVPRSNLIFLRGYSDDGSARVALAFNPDGSFVSGSGDGPEGSFVLRSRAGSASIEFSALSRESTLPKGVKLDFQCGNDKADLHATSVNDLARQLKLASSRGAVAAAATSHALRFATIAVDTDSAFMQNLFNNNTTSAGNWIANMINVMNLMYERDVLVQLQLGTTIYRTTANDPYASGTYAATNVPADGTDLSNFGSYWQANYSTPGPNYITRSFAVLLSGLGPCSGNSCSASGIAWINSYCQNASSGGSYAVVQVFSKIAFDPDGSGAAGLYDHELGHNFGADHTHCTDATTGQYAVATNTIDICYNGEGATHGGGQCYDGATTSCPASGAGTIMSYCDVSACAQNNIRAFSPIQINAAAPYGVVADSNAAPAGCLNTIDDIFYDGFEQPGG
ncbi:MAG: hypothetical protein KGK05_10390, partial [Xanthomonadaceae bacterium]|nr:hypothetical protein [Xanthomonadaceae bacterium]